MNTTTFFEKFALLADAPNAVVKMRELVLELAAHGKLVAQSPDDEPASALIGRIEKHFDLLRSQQKMRGSSIENLGPDGLPVLPATWAWVRLGNVVDYGSSDKSESGAIPEEAWLLDLEDIEKDTSRLIQRKTFRDSPSKSTKTAFAGGDVLYGKLRPYLNKVIVADASGYCTTEIIPIRAFGFIDPMYLCYALRRPQFIAYANSKSYGMNLPRLGTEDARRAPFPLPPLAEQKRIVAKVDELMALCDQLEAQQREREERHAALSRASLARFSDTPTLANLNFLFHKSHSIAPAELRKSILTLAVQGKLVPQDPADEPASTLSSKIAEEKRRLVAAGTIRDKDPATPISKDELPFEIPYGWEWMRLSSITRRIHYGYTASAKADLRDVRLLRITDIQNNFVDWVSVPGCEIRTEEVAQYKLERGDILVARTGGTVGKTYLVQDVPVTAVFASYLIRIQGSLSLFDRYLKLFLESPTYWVQLDEGARGAAQPNVNGQTLGRMVVSVPPLAEQRRIVAKVDELMALVDALEAQGNTARSAASALLDAVVAELTNRN
jgi:type I restriction enzyme S subunit